MTVRLGRSESLTRRSPGSVKAEGTVGSRALLAPRLTTTQCFLSNGKPVQVVRRIDELFAIERDIDGQVAR
jgi:hypothetical protein